MTSLTRSSFFWMSWYSGNARRITIASMRINSGMSTASSSASRGLVTTAMIRLPTMSSGERTRMRSAINSSSWTWFTSLVRRVTSSAVPIRSRLPNDSV